MLKRILLVSLLAAGASLSLGGAAEAVNCRSLQMQLMQFQASREMGQYRRILGAMENGGCIQKRASIFDGARRRVQTQSAPKPTVSRQAARASTRGSDLIPAPAGTFRTLCVRSCDGYYFPVSFSTTRKHFATDQATCERICPGAQSQIYYHSFGEGPESMISLQGSSYRDLPAAFSYRSKLDPSCSCGRPEEADALPVTAGADAAGQSRVAAAAPLPRTRFDPGEDPETLANRDGDFVPRFLARPRRMADAAEGPGSIRKVGADEPETAPTSPVPNDFETSLLWDTSRSGRAASAAGAARNAEEATSSPSAR